MTHHTLPKPAPRYQVKGDKRKAEEAQKREAYRLVDIRDGRCCRACGRRCRSTLEAVADRLEHHHLVFRSRGGKFTTDNLVSLCMADHIEAQQHRLIITGHPDAVLTFEAKGRVWHS